ncbi:MAG: DUF4013 domain-containing protein [Nanoarchaeota archaeon]
MDIQTAFLRPYQKTSQFFLGGLLQIVPILNWVNLGYTLRLSCSAKEKPEYRWGEDFKDGAYATIISFIYSLPALILLTILLLKGLFFIFQHTDLFTSLFAEGPAATEAWKTVLLALWAALPWVIALIIVSVFVSLLIPAAILFYCRKKRFSDAFALGAVLKTAFSGNYLLAALVVLLFSIAYGMALGIVNLIGKIQFIGWAVTMYANALVGFAMMLTSYYLFAQAIPKKP